MSKLEYTQEQQHAIDMVRELPNQSIDLILTDPPYDLGKEIKDSKNFQPKKIKISIFKRILKEISKIFDII